MKNCKNAVLLHLKINATFSIPYFQYHIFNTSFSIPHVTVVKFVIFTKKIVKMKKIHLQNLRFDDFFRENKFSFTIESFWRIFLHYSIFTKNYPSWHQKIPLLILIVNHMIIVNTYIGTYMYKFYYFQHWNEMSLSVEPI